MSKIKGKCICGKTASFGNIGDKSPTCCKECKTDDMINIKNKRCVCGKKIPSFGNIGDKNATCCYECKTHDMIDILHKKCKCGKKRPSFGNIGDKNATCCYECKTHDMIDIVHKKCKCSKIPSFGNIGDKNATCCYECKTHDMIDIINKRCKCGKKRPSFGNTGDKNATCCLECKTDDMINIVHKKCKCGKIPSFGNIGDKNATCCLECKTDDMVDIVNKRCKTPMCETHVNRKYKPFCSRCFFFTYPDTTITRNYKTKENTITKIILKDFPNFDWILDKVVKDGCSKKRPDMYCDFGSHIIIVEIDENQHSNYSCENKRIMELSKDFNHRPIVFIRINPDSYIDENNKKIQSCFIVKKDTGKVEIRSEKELNRRMVEVKKQVIKYSEGFETDRIIITQELFFSN
jgi:hypothetical protein